MGVGFPWLLSRAHSCSIHSRVGDRVEQPRKRRAWIRLAVGALAIVLVAVAVGEYLLSRAEPILRARLTQSLSARYHSRVEMGAFRVSLLRGFQVCGQNLAIFPYAVASTTPTIAVRDFSFRTGYRSLWRSPLRIGRVQVDGLRIHLPPHGPHPPTEPRQPGTPGRTPSISVEEMQLTDTVLTMAAGKPGKAPAEFAIAQLDLHSVGAGLPMQFTASLTNPKPPGKIETNGSFGPWDADQPGATPLNGAYTFTNADLGVFKGIAGTLSSTGHYQGTLSRIVVDGQTDTPDFKLKVSGHPIALHTDFHAIVDGTDGNTYLQPVKAHFLHSTVMARGYVVRAVGEPGHHTFLDVNLDQARIEDVLRLAVRTEPPVMDGALRLRAKLDLPPGAEDVAHRLRLHGQFSIADGKFSNQKIQGRVDEMSLRSQGQVELFEQQKRSGQVRTARSQMSGDFALAESSLQLANLRYQVPGITVGLAGEYSLDGARFHMAGKADMKATMSRMVGGWRGLLLMPFEHMLQKNGAGTEVPFHIDGTQSDPHFGLDLGRNTPPAKAAAPAGIGVGPRQ